MAQISLKDVHYRIGDEALFDAVTLHIEKGDRIVLTGRNGSGKSTLLRMMTGSISPDSGLASIGREVVTAYFNQEAGTGDGAGDGITVIDHVTSAYKDVWSRNMDESEFQVELSKFFSRLEVTDAPDFSVLSGGMKRRALLAACLATSADVLLLDEPTNHLDIDSIRWLEEYIRSSSQTLLLITHDRAFARACATRVAEIDRGQLFCFECGYDEFIRRRKEALEAEAGHRADFDKRLAAEEAWLRRGIKARRTRNEGRVKALVEMRKSMGERRNRSGNIAIQADTGRRSGDLVAEVENVSFGYSSEQILINNLDWTLMRSDKVGIVGPNGSGKTTLLKLLQGDLQPVKGKISLGTRLDIVYFDQMRNTLDETASVKENLAGKDDSVMVNGKQRHINAYLEDFLFDRNRANTPVSILSGGEKNRLVIAKLLLQPANLLILDEPTNDLDLETLEMLEDFLVEYPGTILLVSHDREFLDNIVGSCLVFDGSGRVRESVGGYSDYLAANKRIAAEEAKAANQNATGSEGSSSNEAGKPRQRKQNKLSYKQNQELEALPQRIHELETDIEALHAKLADPELYRDGSGDAVSALTSKLEEQEANLATAYERWEELEELRESLENQE